MLSYAMVTMAVCVQWCSWGMWLCVCLSLEDATWLDLVSAGSMLLWIAGTHSDYTVSEPEGLTWTHWLTDQLSTKRIHPHCTVLHEKLVVPDIVKKIPAFYGTRRLITASIWAPARAYPEPDESTPMQSYPIFLILSSHSHLHFLSGLFPSRFITNIFMYVSFLPCVLHPQPISFSPML